MTHVIVVGAGPAGIMASLAASQSGHQVSLIEKNTELGQKLRITGHGRCNITNTANTDTILSKVVSNPHFLYSALSRFSSRDMIRFLHTHGIRTKTEDGGRVFPISNDSMDIIKLLVHLLHKQHVKIYSNETVRKILVKDKHVQGVLTDKQARKADVVIITTGGKSYPKTGSTGDGYVFAKSCGHTVCSLFPSLTPVETKEQEDLQGLSLSNIHFVITESEKKLYEDTGDLLFTHYGLSGPAILTASSMIGRYIQKQSLIIHIDLYFRKNLDRMLLEIFHKNPNKKIGHALFLLFPHRLVPVLLKRAEIDINAPVHSVTRKQRKRLIECSHDFKWTLTRLRGFHEAMITQGGINIKEMDPSTMSSKKIRGLKFAGEILDVDAQTGGYNLQIAWSTGYLAGISI